MQQARPCTASHLPREFLQVLERRKGRAAGDEERKRERGRRRRLPKGFMHRIRLSWLEHRETAGNRDARSHVWLRTTRCYVNRALWPEKEEDRKRERETIGPVSLRPTMAFPDLLSGTRGRVKGHVKGYITACIPPTAKLNALNPSTQIGERVYVEDIVRAKTTLIFKMCYPSAGHSGLSKEPAGDPPPDTRLNICECGRVWFVSCVSVCDVWEG